MRMTTKPAAPLKMPSPTENRPPPIVPAFFWSQSPAFTMSWLRSIQLGRLFWIPLIQLCFVTVARKAGRLDTRLLTCSAMTGTTAKTRPTKTPRMARSTVRIAAQRGNLCFSSQDTAGSMPRARKSAAPM
jgi:hypothetical protein